MLHRLHVYTVHRKIGSQSPDDLRFVREGFNFFAFIFTIFWALFHRLWVPALALFIVQAMLYSAEQQGWLSALSVMVCQLAVQVITGFLANDWLRAKLKTRDFLMVDVVTGDNKIRAEQRFFDRMVAAQAA
jgi:hypothetical protein